MDANNWNGIMKVKEIDHFDRNGNLKYHEENIKNMLHSDGEEFLLLAAFRGGYSNNGYIPENYYLGLDNRATIALADSISSLIGEPNTATGYQRQAIPSAGQFIVASSSGHWVATSPIVSFRAQFGNWGPVQNLFLATTTNTYGQYLISTATLSQAIEVEDGDYVTLRVLMTLKDCPT